MTYVSDDGPTRGFRSRPFKLDFAPETEGEDDGRAPRDLKKLLLVIGLGGLSWVATYVGMLELIEANMGELPLIHKAIIGFSVAMLMTMIVWLLDQMFAPIGAFTRLCYIAGYLFLSIISVGFGFGFYWKVLESRSESSRSAESAVAQVQGSLHAASTRLEQLQATLQQLTVVSHEKAELERTKGTSCPSSKPGDGPRRKMREDDAQRFSFASDFVKGRVTAVRGELKALDTDLARVVIADKSTFDAKTGTRNEFLKNLGRKLDMTVTGFNAFRTDPQLKQLRTDLADRGDQSTFGDPKKGGFVCPDPQLQAALRGAVRAIDQLPELDKPEIAAVEGSEATIEAFRRLTATFYGALAFKLPPSADELRDLQKKAVQTVEGPGAAHHAATSEATGLSKRDYVPLAIAIFVDICLLLVSMGRPANHLHSLVPKMRAAERGPVIQILSRFNDIHRDPQIRQSFELFRHVVFDWHGDYYVAVPLHAPTRYRPVKSRLREADSDDLEHEAHLLGNLFTSFEKERIFKRVYNPLLNTRAIQKRLERQGSKFAEVDAFRVYRFRDGAYPEIILGAVMGAARRAEAEKQRRNIEMEIYRRREPDLASAAQPAADPVVTARNAPVQPVVTPASARLPDAPLERFPHRSRSVPVAKPETRQAESRPVVEESAVVRMPTLRSKSGQPPLQEEPAALKAKTWIERMKARAQEQEFTPLEELPEERPLAADAEEVSFEPEETYADIDYSAKFGPYAPHVATNGRRRTAREPVPQAAVESLQAIEPLPSPPVVEDKIDVVFSRETATVSVPASGAGLPSLAAMMRRAMNAKAENTKADLAPPTDTPMPVLAPASADTDAASPPALAPAKPMV